ncbi:MAG TPA: hypothetical protein VK964_06975, partial [Nocardioidaceae bacterium]|nr:hypothetical protein [Nocardioidaceae bacterium]
MPKSTPPAPAAVDAEVLDRASVTASFVYGPSANTPRPKEPTPMTIHVERIEGRAMPVNSFLVHGPD